MFRAWALYYPIRVAHHDIMWQASYSRPSPPAAPSYLVQRVLIIQTQILHRPSTVIGLHPLSKHTCSKAPPLYSVISVSQGVEPELWQSKAVYDVPGHILKFPTA
ncbi:hypothetical protein GOODEAATRI_015590 [Goodea atripinnis]|uniref:Uncharacterized protein n=1 Tax=Goodea atripinnis TaxID=208336 RepID=A0ABV0NKK1_9TELE